MKLLWNSWPPNCLLTAPILPPKTVSSLLETFPPYTVSGDSLKPPAKACPDFPHHSVSRYCIQQSNHHAVLFGVTKPRGCMPDGSSEVLYCCIFLRTHCMWPQDMRSFLSLPHIRLPLTEPSPTSAAWDQPGDRSGE